jgi:hypothetical protein
MVHALIGVGELQVLELDGKLAITLGAIRRDDVGRPACWTAVRTHPHVRIDKRGYPPGRSLGFDQQSAIEARLLVR